MAKKVKILQSPVGPYNLANRIGDVIELDDELVEKMVKSGHAEIVTEKKADKGETK